MDICPPPGVKLATVFIIFLGKRSAHFRDDKDRVGGVLSESINRLIKTTKRRQKKKGKEKELKIPKKLMIVRFHLTEMKKEK